MNKLRTLGGAFFLLVFLSPPARTALDTKISMPEFDPNLEWVDNRSVTRQDLTDHVAVIYFWNLSTVESLLHLPFLNQLNSIFQPYHFKAIGIHTPQYDFEKKKDVISNLSDFYHLNFPIALDNENRMKSLYQTYDIPTFYIIDSKGRIKKTIFNEYDHSMIIKAVSGALQETMTEEFPSISETISKQTFSPFFFLEIPLGYQRLSHFGNLEKIRATMDQEFIYPDFISENQFYLNGPWRFESDHLRALGNKCSIRIRTSYRGLTIIADPLESKALKATVTAAGIVFDKNSIGKDANPEGKNIFVKIDTTRAYNLVDLKNKPETSVLYEITFENPIHLYGLTLSDAPFSLKSKKNEEDERRASEVSEDDPSKEGVELTSSFQDS